MGPTLRKKVEATAKKRDAELETSQAKAKEAGKLRIEGKDYVVQDGDVMEFRFNV